MSHKTYIWGRFFTLLWFFWLFSQSWRFFQTSPNVWRPAGRSVSVSVSMYRPGRGCGLFLFGLPGSHSRIVNIGKTIKVILNSFLNNFFCQKISSFKNCPISICLISFTLRSLIHLELSRVHSFSFQLQSDMFLVLVSNVQNLELFLNLSV